MSVHAINYLVLGLQVLQCLEALSDLRLRGALCRGRGGQLTHGRCQAGDVLYACVCVGYR